MSYYFTELTPQEFKDYTVKEPISFQQSIEMGYLREQRGYQFYYIGVKDDANQILYACLLHSAKLRIGSSFEIAELPLWKNEYDDIFWTKFIPGLKDFVKNHGGLYLNIWPRIPHQFVHDDGSNEIVDDGMVERFTEHDFSHSGYQSGINLISGMPNWIYVKDMKDLGSAEDVTSSYTSQGRYSIRKAREFGIYLREIDQDELIDFKAITEDTSERIGFSDKELSYYELVKQIYGDRAKFIMAELNLKDYLTQLKENKKDLNENIQSLEADLSKNPNSRKKNNQHKELTAMLPNLNKRIKEAEEWHFKEDKDIIQLACALFFIHPNEVIYMHSGTVEEYKHLYAPYLIQDEMIHWTGRHDIPLYNFYGISGAFDGSDGVLHFKQSFNGYAIQYIGKFTHIASPLKYKIYSTLKSLIGR